MIPLPGKPAPVHLIATGLLLAANGLLVHIGWQALKSPPIPVTATATKMGLGIPEAFDMTLPADVLPGRLLPGDALARPLFTSERHPYRPPPEPAVEPDALVEIEGIEEALPLDHLLVGVVIDAARRQALLRDHASMTDHWVNEGETMDGWRLVRVEPAGVTLEAGNQRVVLELYPPALVNP